MKSGMRIKRSEDEGEKIGKERGKNRGGERGVVSIRTSWEVRGERK